jgi:hypothetical protein
VRFARPRGPEKAPDDDWSRALADACEGKLQALRVAQGLKRDTAQQGLEIWLRAATAWMRGLAAPGQGAAPPRGVSAETLGRLVAETLEALRALERNGNPSLLVESIIIRASRRG